MFGGVMGEFLTILGVILGSAVIGAFLGLAVVLGLSWLLGKWISYCEKRFGDEG